MSISRSTTCRLIHRSQPPQGYSESDGLLSTVKGTENSCRGV